MFFLGPVLFGAFLGIAVTRAARWHRRHHHHHHQGGCGHGRFRGFGMHGGFRGFGLGRRAFFIIRELGLTTDQMSQLKPVWLKARAAVASVQASGVEALHAVFDSAMSEPFDKSRLDEAARRHTEDHGAAARDLVDSIARVMEILTPEQREKVRARFARFGVNMGEGRGPFGPDGGPYRSGTYV